VFCARDYFTELQDMDFELYKKIIDGCPSTKIVQTQGAGEPLLYPHFIGAVSYAKRKGKYVVFYTNASLLHEGVSEILLELGLDRIIFSVEECEKERYEALRRGLSWDSVLDNILTFQRLRTSGGYKTKTCVRMTRTEENNSRVRGIAGFWSDKVDKVVVMPEVYIPPPSELIKDKWTSGKPVVCRNVNEHLSVKSNGDMVLCCRDWFNVYPIHNLNDVAPLDAFNSVEFDEVRESMRGGVNYPSICRFCKFERAPRR